MPIELNIQQVEALRTLEKALVAADTTMLSDRLDEHPFKSGLIRDALKLVGEVNIVCLIPILSEAEDLPILFAEDDPSGGRGRGFVSPLAHQLTVSSEDRQISLFLPPPPSNDVKRLKPSWPAHQWCGLCRPGGQGIRLCIQQPDRRHYLFV